MSNFLIAKMKPAPKLNIHQLLSSDCFIILCSNALFAVLIFFIPTKS